VLSQIDNGFIWIPLKFHAETLVAHDFSSLAGCQTYNPLQRVIILMKFELEFCPNVAENPVALPNLANVG
jgi:hypothetical protein